MSDLARVPEVRDALRIHTAAGVGIATARLALRNQLAAIADEFDALADQAALQERECRAIAGLVRGECE